SSGDRTMTRDNRSTIQSWCVRATALTALLLLCVGLGASFPSAAGGAVPLPVTAVDVVGFTVSDMDSALAFYTGVLPFSKVSDQELAERSYELLSGVFGARSRVVRLRL